MIIKFMVKTTLQNECGFYICANSKEIFTSFFHNLIPNVLLHSYYNLNKLYIY